MKLSSIDDIVYKDIEAMIDKIKAKKNRYLFLYRATKILVFVSGAIITILTGSKDTLKICPNNSQIVHIISVCITLFTAIESLFSFRDKGKGNNMLLYELRRLRDRICFDYSKNRDMYNLKRDEYFEEYQKLLEAQKLMIENADNEDSD